MLEVGDGVVELVAFDEAVGQVDVRGGEVRRLPVTDLNIERVSIGDFGTIEMALPGQRQAKVTVCQQVVGLESRRLLEVQDGFVEAVLVQAERAQVVPGHPGVGVLGDGVGPERVEVVVDACLPPR